MSCLEQRKGKGKYFDPDALLESISNASIALVRGRWLVAHYEGGGKLMRRQDLPKEAFFGVEELRKLIAAFGNDWGLLFVAISCRWLDTDHPDPNSFHLAVIAKVAKIYLSGRDEYNRPCSPLVEAFKRVGYSGTADFGLMWDFMSLHQRPAGGGELNPQEAGLFALGRSALPIWFGHAETVVWMQPKLPEGFAERVAPLNLAETYEASGWCFVESSMSLGGSGRRHGDRRLNLSLRKEATEAAYGNSNFPADWCLNRVCAVKRKPLRDPGWVAKELRTTKKFTCEGDANLVDGLYRDYFDSVTSSTRALNFSGLQWGDAEVASLALVLPRYDAIISVRSAQARYGTCTTCTICTTCVLALCCATSSLTMTCSFPLPIDRSSTSMPTRYGCRAQ